MSSIFTNLFWVFLGCGFGGVCRYFLGVCMGLFLKSSLPLATLLSNLLACFILGLIWMLVLKHKADSNMLMILGTGFCGGLSTFSTFSLESFILFDQKNYLLSAVYMMLSIFLGLMFLRLGFFVAQRIIAL